MRANRRRDTKPELELRSSLHRMGLRYRVDYPIQTDSGRVRPDIAFTRRKIAIFVDGCFWHGCPEHFKAPTQNSSYWTPKIRRNAERDLEQVAALERIHWTVVRYWEHQDPLEAASEIRAMVQSA